MKAYVKIIALLSLFAASACVKEEVDDGAGLNSDLLSFSATTGIGWNNNGAGSQTKSGGELTLLSAEGDSLNLNLTVSDDFSTLESISDQMSETKGVMITGSTLSSYQIGLNAFLSGTSNLYIDDQLERQELDPDHSYKPGDTWVSSGHWAPVDNHTYYWPKAANLDFWAWAPYEKIDAAIKNEADGSAVKISDFTVKNAEVTPNISFTYDLGTTAATAQPDLMFAAADGLAKGSDKLADSGCVPLPFTHALAAVKFKVSSNVAGTLKSIKIGKAARTGKCVYNGSNFAWTVSSTDGYHTDKCFEQTFNIGVAKDATVEAVKNDDKGNNEAVFMMIPQTLKAKTETDYQTVAITFQKEGEAEKTFTGCLCTAKVSEWEAGKVYVYTISIPDVSITVDDEVTETVKSDLTITNTGTTPSYIRATIVANWVNEAGRVAAPLKSTDGAFTSLCPTGWVASGGYYYHTAPVAANGTATPLFDTYTVKADVNTAKKKAGLHLEMDIIVQAISASGYTDYKDAWKKAAGLTL